MDCDPESTMEALDSSCEHGYKRLLKETPPGVGRDILSGLKLIGYTKIVKDMVKTGQVETPVDWPEEMKTVADATAHAAIHAREAQGDRKLAMLHASLQFCRCVSGKPGKIGSVYVAWICPRCKHMPERDVNWWQCEGNFDGHSWF